MGQKTFLKKTNFMAPFYGWGSTASRLEPLRGGSLLFTTKFPEVPGTHFIDLERMTNFQNCCKVANYVYFLIKVS